MFAFETLLKWYILLRGYVDVQLRARKAAVVAGTSTQEELDIAIAVRNTAAARQPPRRQATPRRRSGHVFIIRLGILYDGLSRNRGWWEHNYIT